MNLFFILSATTRDGSAWDETRFLRDAASGLVTNPIPFTVHQNSSEGFKS